MPLTEVFHVFYRTKHSIAVCIPPGSAVIVDSLDRDSVYASDVGHVWQININTVEVAKIETDCIDMLHGVSLLIPGVPG